MTTFTTKIDRILDVVERARPKFDPETFRMSPVDLHRTIAPNLAAFWSAADQITATVAQLLARRLDIAADTTLTDEGKQAAWAPVLTEAQARINAYDEVMNGAYKTIETVAAQQAQVQRPGEVSQQQLAELTEMRSKWQLVLDALDATALEGRLLRFIEAASVAGKDLEVWALVEDDWPALYLESRGASAELYTQRAQELIAPSLSEEARQARQLQRDVHSPTGLAGAIQAMQHWTYDRVTDGAKPFARAH